MRVSSKTRDELNITSKQGQRLISLDFNSAGPQATGIEVVCPSDSTEIEKEECRRWALLTKRFFKLFGHDVPIRHNDGIIRNPRRGVSGIIHLEPFFIQDRKAVDIIMVHSQWYAAIVAATVGQIPGAIVIPPHKSNDPGAVSNIYQISERDFAKSYLISPLQAVSDGEPEEEPDEMSLIKPMYIKSIPWVGWIEERRHG